MAREPVILLRAVEAVLIPQGEAVLLPEGTWLVQQQSLGGSFTLMTDRGQLVRVDGRDADALGEKYAAEAAAAAGARAATLEGPFDEQKVWEALGQVFDPEIPASIVDLGLVYELVHTERPEGGRAVTIRMTLTAPGCGVAPMILDDVRERVAKVPGVGAVDVELVFDPPWTPEKMSEAARLQLGFW